MHQLNWCEIGGADRIRTDGNNGFANHPLQPLGHDAKNL